MIEVEALTKRFGPLTAVDRLTFSVADGEILGFLGPNGAGKTTTMRILTGFMPASEGRARVAGFDLGKDSLEVRRRVGYLPESVPIYRERTVTDYLSFVADVKGVPIRGKSRAIAEVVERCGLRDVRRRIVGRLSRGYRQRVGVAQALLNDPPVLILDEPTVGLDPSQVVEIRDLIKGLAGKRTVILSTHILPEVSQICSRVLIINRGHIAASGTPEELTARLQSSRGFRVRVGGDPERAAAVISGLPGVVGVHAGTKDGAGGVIHVDAARDQDVRGAISRALVTAGIELLELTAQSLSLEEIFLSLTREDPAAAEPAAGVTTGPELAAGSGSPAGPAADSADGGRS